MDLTANESFPYIPGGFNFENSRRNQAIFNDKKISSTIPQGKKTGTTICGVVYEGGVVIGADTRSTSSLVVEKDCEKIHYIAPNIYCCGAGTAADTEFTTGQIASQLELQRLDAGRHSRVVTARTLLTRHLFKYQGQVSAALVLGGVDITGPHLYTVYPHGSFDTLPFVSMGSGSLAAMSVLETGFQDKMSRQDAIDLVAKAIRGGVMNDLGSGNSINYCIIERDESKKGFEAKVEMWVGTEQKEGLNPVAMDTVRTMNKESYMNKVKLPNYFANFPPGTTVTIGEPIIEKF